MSSIILVPAYVGGGAAARQPFEKRARCPEKERRHRREDGLARRTVAAKERGTKATAACLKNKWANVNGNASPGGRFSESFPSSGPKRRRYSRAALFPGLAEALLLATGRDRRRPAKGDRGGGEAIDADTANDGIYLRRLLRIRGHIAHRAFISGAGAEFSFPTICDRTLAPSTLHRKTAEEKAARPHTFPEPKSAAEILSV